MNTAVKEAQADAKAANARVKALRPWYRKKRYWAIAILALVIGVAAAGGGASSSKSSKSPKSPSSGVSSAFGSSDATADITSIQVERPPTPLVSARSRWP